MKCILFLVKVIYIILQQFQVRQRQLYFLLYGQSGNNFELIGQQNNINILNPIQARLLRALKSRSGGGVELYGPPIVYLDWVMLET